MGKKILNVILTVLAFICIYVWTLLTSPYKCVKIAHRKVKTIGPFFIEPEISEWSRTGPVFVDPAHKKRKRRGHRGGRKHKRNKRHH